MKDIAISRRGLLAGAAVSAGSALSLPALAGGSVGGERSAAEQLRRASQAELGLHVAWDSAAKSGVLSPPVARFARSIRDQELEHHEKLEERAAALGMETGAVRPAAESVPGLAAARTRERMLAVLATLEAEAIDLYVSALAEGVDAETASLLGQIAGSQGQHLVVVRRLRGADPVPEALAPTPGRPPG